MFSPRTILLVEDEEQVRILLAGLLAAHAWIVTAVASGDEALARLAAFEFDIVLCELDLGRGPNGLDTLSRMPPRNKRTPFVILTAHGSTGRCREAFLRGAIDFIERPIRQAVLLATLRQALAEAAEQPIEITSEDAMLGLPDCRAGAALVRRGIQIIERLFGESDLTIAHVARQAGSSPEHFSRTFRARTGRTAVEHLHEVRIRHAEPLLVNSGLSIYEIGFECGYKRNSEFSSWYRRLRGSTPSRLRRPN